MTPDLPSNWDTWRLGDVGTWYGGGTPASGEAKYWDGDIPWVSPKDMKVLRLKTSIDKITSEAIENSAAKLIPAGAVLFVTRSGILAHSFPVAVSDVPITVNQDIKAIKPVDVIDPVYLSWALRAAERKILSSCSKHGTTVHSIEMPSLKDLHIPIPPEPEQRRIVAKIEELFSELDKSVESLTTAREQLKVYRQSVLNKAVEGKGTALQSFPKKALSAVVSELGQGWSPRCLNHPAPNDETWAVITTTAIQHASFREQENKQLPAELQPRPHLSISAGDILITRAGPRKRVGVACLVKRCRPRLMLCDKAYRLRADVSLVLPEWLEMVLNSPSILQEIEEIKTGINDSGVNLTQDRFLELEVPVPGLTDQKTVLATVDSLTSQITNLESQIEAAMRQADALRQSILKRAFSGQLVAQDPADEPASILLERIRAEHGAGKLRTRRTNKTTKKEAA